VAVGAAAAPVSTAPSIYTDSLYPVTSRTPIRTPWRSPLKKHSPPALAINCGFHQIKAGLCRHLHHWVIARRIGMGTRTPQGTRAFALLASVIETCRKRAVSPWPYLAEVIRQRTQRSARTSSAHARDLKPRPKWAFRTGGAKRLRRF
jgi:hypothetical protein